jgi:uncharacterized protein YeaO (DUF488 family)
MENELTPSEKQYIGKKAGQIEKELRKEIEPIIKEIKNANLSLINSKQEIEELKSKAQKAANKIEEVHNNATALDEQIDDFWLNYIDELDNQGKNKLERVKAYVLGLNETANNVNSIVQKLHEVELKIIGNEEKEIQGLEAKFNEQFNKTTKDLQDREDQYKALLEKINDLLPGATTIALTKAYETQGLKYKMAINLWTGVFLTGLAILIITGCTLTGIDKLTDFPLKFAQRLPIIIPVVWLVIYAGKSRSQFVRLREEYAHKENLARTYEGYRIEVDKLPVDSTPNGVKAELLKTIINMASYNPSATLQDKSHKEISPIEQIIKTTTNVKV